MASEAAREEDYLRGLGRAVGGALIFGFPLMMTMEMWQLGFHMDRLRLAAFLLAIVATVVGLSRFAGFRDETTFTDDLLDAAAALLAGTAVSAAMLGMLGLFGPRQGADEIIGMVAMQAAPASIGAILANKQLHGEGRGRPKEDRAGYLGQLFLMAAGGLFFAFNVAPTEEMILIGFKMTPLHAVGLIALSLAVLHALVFSVGFAGQHAHEGHAPAFFHYTVVGYGLALVVSAFTLWVFGRLDGGLSDAVRAIVVLAFPAALGAAIARLVV